MSDQKSTSLGRSNNNELTAVDLKIPFRCEEISNSKNVLERWSLVQNVTPTDGTLHHLL